MRKSEFAEPKHEIIHISNDDIIVTSSFSIVDPVVPDDPTQPDNPGGDGSKWQ